MLLHIPAVLSPDDVAACRQVLAVRRDFPEAPFWAGQCAEGARRLEDAAAAYRAVLARKPDFPQPCSTWDLF